MGNMCNMRNNRQYEKPDDCPICYEPLAYDRKNLLSCGHWLHYDCFMLNVYARRNLPIECPICRAKVNIPPQRNILERIKKVVFVSFYIAVNFPYLVRNFFQLYRLLSRQN